MLYLPKQNFLGLEELVISLLNINRKIGEINSQLGDVFDKLQLVKNQKICCVDLLNKESVGYFENLSLTLDSSVWKLGFEIKLWKCKMDGSPSKNSSLLRNVVKIEILKE